MFHEILQWHFKDLKQDRFFGRRAVFLTERVETFMTIGWGTRHEKSVWKLSSWRSRQIWHQQASTSKSRAGGLVITQRDPLRIPSHIHLSLFLSLSLALNNIGSRKKIRQSAFYFLWIISHCIGFLYFLVRVFEVRWYPPTILGEFGCLYIFETVSLYSKRNNCETSLEVWIFCPKLRCVYQWPVLNSTKQVI